MVRRQRSDREVERRPVATARGGLSLGGILTGVVVAFGALFLLSAIVGGAFASSGVDPGDVTDASTTDVGIGVGIGLIVAWFLACLWGGYTAGRMARGAGLLNGILVPILVLVLGLLVGAVVAALGETASLNLPFTTPQLPTQDSAIGELSLGFGIGILVAMLVGGALGGSLGQRWHTKLERRAIDEEEEKAEQERARHRERDERARERDDRTDETRRDAARGDTDTGSRRA
jgi:hypothetical protein